MTVEIEGRSGHGLDLLSALGLVTWTGIWLLEPLSGLLRVGSSASQFVGALDDLALLPLSLVALAVARVRNTNAPFGSGMQAVVVSAIAVGAVSSFAHNELGVMRLLLGAWLYVKPWLFFWVGFTLGPFASRRARRYALQIVTALAVVVAGAILIELFASSVHAQIFTPSRAPGALTGISSRDGLRVSRSIFPHPGSAHIPLVQLAVIGLSLRHLEPLKASWVGSMVLIVASLLTLRIRAFASVLLVGFALVEPQNRYRQLAVRLLCLSSVLGLAVWGQSSLSLIGDQVGGRLASTNPRGALSEGALALATESFPGGRGLGTFASPGSLRPYSDAYLEVGANQIYGLAPLDPFAAFDMGWAAPIAELGFIGATLYFLGLLMGLGRFCVRHRGAGRETTRTIWLLIGIIAVQTTGGPALFAPFVWLSLGGLANLASQTWTAGEHQQNASPPGLALTEGSLV